jgi:cytochrome P450 PksS
MIDTLQTYDIFSHEVRSNPQPLYAQMRAESPVHRYMGFMGQDNPLWVLTRYDDCVMYLKDPRFGKQIHDNLSPEQANRYWTQSDPNDPWVAINKHMLNLDPPDHTRLRTLVHKAFTPRMVENLRPRIHSIANNLLDEMGDHGTGDLIEHYAFPLPMTVIAEMLGIPAADRDQFRRWTKLLLFGGNPGEDFTALMEFAGYMNNMIHERREKPQEDIISALVQAEEGGDKLDHMELLSMLFLLLVAGHETTVNLIGNGTLALLQHPDQLEKLRQNPDLIKPAVEEILRYNGPVDITTTRWTFDDVEIGGTVIPKGEAVWAALLAANRDPAQFENPDVFDITRDPNKHIGFGNGIHYCVGAPLARLEGAIALNALVQRLPDLELAVPQDDLHWTTGVLIIHGMLEMPVRY